MHNIGKLLIQQAEIVANCDGMATDDRINAIQRLKLHSGINPLVGTRTMLKAISYIFTLTALWDDLVVSEDESKLVRRKLQVWDPELSEDQLKELGEVSLLSYQRDVLTGDSTEYLRAMIILRKRLTPEQVANLQNDLEEIARIKSIQEGQANYLLMVNNFFAEKSFVQKVGQKFGFNLV